MKISVGKHNFVFEDAVPLDKLTGAPPAPAYDFCQNSTFSFGICASCPGAKSRAHTGSTTCFCKFPLVHEAGNPAVKPLMEQTLSILEDISYSTCYKITLRSVEALLVMSLKSRALQPLKSKFPCPSGDRPVLA